MPRRLRLLALTCRGAAARRDREDMNMEEKEIATETTETREQILEVINFYLPTLTERQLRMVRGFIRGLKRDKKRE